MPTPTLLQYGQFDTTELLRHCRNRLQALDEVRATWLAFCTSVAEELFPAKLQSLLNPTQRQRAGEQNESICDAVGHLSLTTAAGGVWSGSMPQTSRWFTLKISGLFEEDDDERWFLDLAGQRLMDLHNQANTNNVAPELFKEWLAFGVGACLFLDDPEASSGFRIEPLSVGEYWIADDARGRVDTIYRKFTMNVGQMVQEYGYDRLCGASKAAYDDKRYDEIRTIVHAIEPDRDGRNPIASKAHKWRSVYYEEGTDATNGGVLAIRGYHRFPGLVWRYGRVSGSPYAYGLGHEVLPHLLRMRRLIYRYGQALAFQTEPALQLPAGMSQHEVKMLPGGATTLYGGEKIETLFQPTTNLRDLAEQIGEAKQDVRDVLGATLVASLRRLRQQMTKAEAEIRKSEDLAEFLPGLLKLHEEFLSPYVEQLWELAEWKGWLPPQPASLRTGQVGQIDIEFTSPLARHQRQGEADAIVRVYAIAAEMAKVPGHENVGDNLDSDAALRLIAEIEGAPARILKPMAAMRDLREARIGEALAQKQAGAVAEGVDVARTAAEAQKFLGEAA